MDHIHVRNDENRAGYEATINGGDPLPGKSPDEALGHAVRTLWLCKEGLDLEFRLTMNTE